MYLSTLTTWRLPAVALAVILWGLGSPALQAKNNHQQGCGCPAPVSCGCPAPIVQKPAPCCAAPVLQKPTLPQPTCCAMPVVRPKPCGPAPTSCCPVDPKDISKAEKEALHAQHEAAEACKKQQQAVAHGQHELDEAYARAQSKIQAANDKLNHEVSEFAEANAKYESLTAPSSEAAAETNPK